MRQLHVLFDETRGFASIECTSGRVVGLGYGFPSPTIIKTAVSSSISSSAVLRTLLITYFREFAPRRACVQTRLTPRYGLEARQCGRASFCGSSGHLSSTCVSASIRRLSGDRCAINRARGARGTDSVEEEEVRKEASVGGKAEEPANDGAAEAGGRRELAESVRHPSPSRLTSTISRSFLANAAQHRARALRIASRCVSFFFPLPLFLFVKSVCRLR